MDCTDLYLKINHNLQENIQASLSSSHYTLFANANAFIDDYGLWQKWIAEKYGIEIFSLALSEYETALLFAVQSLYKQAFTTKRMSEYGASNSCYEPLSSKKLIELEASNNQFLQDQLAKSIDFLDLTDWQKEKLHSVSINTIGELAASNESAVMKAYYVGEVRAKQMKNAAYAALFEYLLG